MSEMASTNVAWTVLQRVWDHPANRSRKVSSIARVATWQIWQRVVRRPLTVDAFDGMELHLRPGSHSAAAVFYLRLPDWPEMSFLRDVLRPGDGFLDVGANVGIYTLLAASIAGRDATIVAIEPNSSARWQLAEHVAANRLSNVRIVPSAVAARSGWVRMTQELGSMNHVLERQDDAPADAGDWMECKTIDAICGAWRPTFAKMDVEGYELEALSGAESVLATRRPAAWILEANETGERYGNDAKRLASWIEDHGGELFHYDAERRALTTHSSRPRSGDANLLAVFDREFVEERLRERRASHD